jgi:hypothetical protein
MFARRPSHRSNWQRWRKSSCQVRFSFTQSLVLRYFYYMYIFASF